MITLMWRNGKQKKYYHLSMEHILSIFKSYGYKCEPQGKIGPKSEWYHVFNEDYHVANIVEGKDKI